MSETHFTCGDCGVLKPVKPSGGTGYANTADGARICYDCCAIRDRADMVATGKALLYLTHDNRTKVAMGWCGTSMPGNDSPWQVSNWPGTLKFNAYVKRGHHNLARRRLDAWFIGPDGYRWHGVNIGDNEVLRCKRTKSKG